MFAIGVYSAQELGDYDTMLARTELSKARSSILKLLSTRSGPAEREGDTAVLDAELRRLSTAIAAARGPAPPTIPPA